jgi:indolepyruvate ferredoxin oxidoreductase alpha subunit
MAERSFAKEVQALKLGDGETFRGEGILAVTKALLQSGVAYVGGYQGAPVSHLLDVLVDAEDMMAELGVHLETCTNEASAAAMLGASINYPLRGAVTWKSIVGTNVAADALSNLSSPGVLGGAMIILGEDYGEGASVIQERSYAYAMKSSMWLLDPRPDLPTIVRMVEKGFELSEATHAPVMLELRVRACHVTGEFTAKNNRASAASGLNRIADPARFNYAKLAHPPLTFVQEKLKVDERLPAAQAFAREHKLNEFFDGDLKDLGIVVLGGLTNTVLRALSRLGLADHFGNARIPIYCLNLAYPLIPDEVKSFCIGKKDVLIVEEGYPDYVEQGVNTELRRADIQTRLHGKGALPKAGEYTSEVVLRELHPRRQARRYRCRRDGGDGRQTARPQERGDCDRRRTAAAPAQFLHRLPGAAGVRSDQAHAARNRPDAYLGRHRLPFVRDLRAVQHGQLDPRLRHVARERGGGRAQPRAPPDLGDGRRRLLA